MDFGCSFTGHRKIEVRHKKEIYPLIERAVDYAYREGCRRFYTGGAIGFDTLSARAVINFRISHPDVSLILVLPCIDQDKAWSAEERDAYGFVLSVANEIVYVSDEYYVGCMKDRNEKLAELGDLLIAYLGNAKSGAGQTVRMAQKLGKRVYNLYPALERDCSKKD